jgi:hypothetical protein
MRGATTFIRQLGQVLTSLPLMSFTTNKNGTFAPSITTATGHTLRWNIDGIDYITNSPSVQLTGATVHVKIYANNFINGDAIDVNFSNQNIIGGLDFSYFTLSGLFHAYSNPNLTSITFSTNANSSSSFSVDSTGLTTLDLSSFTLSGLFRAS